MALQFGQMPLNPQQQSQAPTGIMYSMLAGGSPSAAPTGVPQQMAHPGGFNMPMLAAMNPQWQQFLANRMMQRQQQQGGQHADWRNAMQDWRSQRPDRSSFFGPQPGGAPVMAPGGASSAPVGPQGFAATTNPQPGRLY